MKRCLRYGLLALGLISMLGCATPFTAMETPDIGVVSVEPLASEGPFEQRARVELRITNPNDFDLHVTGVSFKLAINGKGFASGVSNKSFIVPRLGEAKSSLVVSTTVLEMFRQLMGLEENQNLNYAITGKIYLEKPRRAVAFEHSGDLQEEM